MRKKNPSRSDRLEAIKDKILEEASEIETLKDELQSWLDNLPENLQSSEKATQLDEAIAALDEMQQGIDDALAIDVEFPGAFGR